MTPRYPIPADAIPGLLDGWTGEIEVNYGSTRAPNWHPAGIFRGDHALYMMAKRINPARPEVAHRIADALRSLGHEVRVLLPRALGGEQGETVEVLPGDPDPAAMFGRALPIRRTVPASEVSAALLAASVAGVVAGRGVVRGVLGEWRVIAHADPDTGSTWIRSPIIGKRDGGLWVAECLQSWRAFGWECSLGTDPLEPWRWLRGPETGAAGRAAADAAALRLGWALLLPDAPSGVVVPTWGQP